MGSTPYGCMQKHIFRRYIPPTKIGRDISIRRFVLCTGRPQNLPMHCSGKTERILRKHVSACICPDKTGRTFSSFVYCMSGPQNPPVHCIQIVRLDAQKIFHTSAYMGRKSVYADK